MYQLQSSISELAAAKQERDVRKAENMYTNTLTAAQKYMKPDGSFDANAAAQDPFLSTLKDSDYKKMADTLQESWLNPKSTTPHKEGLKQAQAKFDAQQQQRGKLDKFVQGLIHKATAPLRGGPQLTPEQQQAQTATILGRAPLGPAGGSVQDATSIAKTTLELAQAQKALQQKYAVTTDYDSGKSVAYDPANPHDAFALTYETDKGEKQDVGGKPAAKEGQLASLNGIPYGVFTRGHVSRPGDADFTPRFQEMMEAGNNSYVQKRLLGVPGQLLALVGDPPNPAKYSDGTADPKYGDDLKAWGKKVQDQINQNAAFAGVTRVQAQQMARVIPGVDPENPGKVSWTTASYALSHGWETPQSADAQTVRRTQEYFATGQGGTQGVAFYTANLHADLLQQAADALDNKKIQALNAVNNRLKTEFGDPAVTNYNTIAEAYTREVARMMNVAHVTDKEIADAGAQLGDKSSPEQIRGAINALKQLSQSKMWVLNKQRELGMQGKSIVSETPGGGGPTPQQPARQFQVPKDAPPAPKQDNSTLKDKAGNVIAKSKGGKWVSPTTP